MGSTRINLNGVSCLLADSEHYTRDLVAQMLRGFGLNQPILADTGKEAKEIFKHQCPELFITEAVLPDMSSADLIRWIRRLNGPIRFVPTIVLTGYTQLKTVANVRDGGANIVVKKPVSPNALFERMLWIARVARPFVETGDYIGPDRRFRAIDPPDGSFKRDTDDPALKPESDFERAGENFLQKVKGQASTWLAK